MMETYRITDRILFKHGLPVPAPLPDALEQALADEAAWEAEKIRLYREEEQRRMDERQRKGPMVFAWALSLLAVYGAAHLMADAITLLHSLLAK